MAVVLGFAGSMAIVCCLGGNRLKVVEVMWPCRRHIVATFSSHRDGCNCCRRRGRRRSIYCCHRDRRVGFDGQITARALPYTKYDLQPFPRLV